LVGGVGAGEVGKIVRGSLDFGGRGHRAAWGVGEAGGRGWWELCEELGGRIGEGRAIFIVRVLDGEEACGGFFELDGILKELFAAGDQMVL
jgi:hypothetical protein